MRSCGHLYCEQDDNLWASWNIQMYDRTLDTSSNIRGPGCRAQLGSNIMTGGCQQWRARFIILSSRTNADSPTGEVITAVMSACRKCRAKGSSHHKVFRNSTRELDIIRCPQRDHKRSMSALWIDDKYLTSLSWRHHIYKGHAINNRMALPTMITCLGFYFRDL